MKHCGLDEVGQTPDVGSLLERFVALDYLLRDKIEEPEAGRKRWRERMGRLLIEVSFVVSTIGYC